MSFRNCGVSGERTDEIASRLDACAAGASVLMVQGGLNDIAQGRSVDSAADRLEAMVRSGRARGLPVAVAELLPWTYGHPDADDDVLALNGRLRAIARRHGATLLPWYAALEDPDEPGQMDERYDADGYHPNDAGYEVLERVTVPRLRALLERAERGG